MKVADNFGALSRIRKPLVLAAGFFDGVHLGHRRVLARARAEANRRGAQAWALTFDEHPARALRPAIAPPLLTSATHKLRLLAETGLDGVVMLRFTRRFAAMPPEAFARLLLESAPTLQAVVVGRNWSFGRGGAGNAELLRQLLGDRGVDVRVASPLRLMGSQVSSTRIRGLVARGRMKAAAKLLGRPFSIQGEVIHGLGLGRKLGAPTANVEPRNEAQPPFGVYAALVSARGRLHGAVASLGARPTIGAPAAKPLLEAHLLDASPNLYGREIEIFFLARLRAERIFPSLAALQAQIRLDVARARKLLPAPSKKIARECFTRTSLCGRVRRNSKH